MPAAAEERYMVEGTPQMLADHALWDFKGLWDLVIISDLSVLHWLHNHHLKGRGEVGVSSVGIYYYIISKWPGSCAEV